MNPAKVKASLSVVVLLALGLVLSSGGKGCSIGGESPAFAATVPTVLIVEDDTAEGRQKLTTDQDDFMRSNAVDSARSQIKAAGGEWQVLSKNADTTKDTPNIKAAWAVADKVNVPSIVAASPKIGIKPQSLPKTLPEENKLLAPLGVK